MSTIKAIDVQVSGFDPETKYNFIFKNKGGNWPVRVSPLSGVFFPKSVKTYVYFCSNSGECPESDPNVFYNVPENSLTTPGLDLSNKSLYTVLDLEIRDNISDELLHTHPCIIECDQCIPKLSLSFNNNNGDISLTKDDGNSKIFNVKCEGLIPNQEYTYEINGGGGNWPLKITPRSGVITTSSSDFTINGLLSFCPSTGACPSTDPSIINYQNIQNRRFSEDPYSIVDVSLIPTDSTFQNKVVGSFSATCLDCIPAIQILSPNFVNIGSNHSDNEFEVTINNLVVGEQYNYSFTGVDGNWPLILSPQSGSIIATSDSMKLPVVATFCTATGLCPSGSPGIMPYTNLRSSSVALNSIKKQSRFKMSLNQNAYATPVAYSNDIVAVCDDCLPLLRARLPLSTTLSSEEGNYAAFNLQIDNMVPGIEYQYVFKNIDSNWPAIINPLSGSIIRTNEGGITYTVPASITLCQSTGLCPNGCANVLGYTAAANCNNKIARFKAEITAVGYDVPSVNSNAYIVTCNDCIAQPTATIPNVTVNSNNDSTFNVTVSNLSPTSEYRYKFVSLDANWPVSISPISGVISSVSNHTLAVSTSFCQTTGICPNGSPNILPYTAGSSQQFNFGSLEKFAKIRLEIDPVLPLNNDLPTVYSNESLIKCSDCLPDPEIVLPDTIVIDSINPVKFFMSGVNLLEGIEYTYRFIGSDSNWPTVLSPISGNIISSKTFKIPVEASFCASTGICPTGSRNVLNYTLLNNNQYTLGLMSKTSKAKLELTPNTLGLPKIYSNETTIICSGCLDPLSAEFKTSFINNPSKASQNNNIKLNFNGLIPGVEYSYVLESVKNNWPMTVNPMSGTLVSTNTSGEATIYYDICYSTGLCPNDSLYVLPYTYTADSETRKQFNVRAKVQALNSSLPEAQALSNVFSIRCDNTDCLPKVTITGIPATGGIGFRDSYRITPVVKNLLPDVVYSYKYKSLDANWPSIVYPASGIIRNASGYEIPTSIQFCKSTGLCPNDNTSSVLSYNLDSVCQTTNNELAFTKFVNFILEVEPLAAPGLSKVISNASLLTMTNNIGGLEITYNAPLNTDGGTVIGSNDGISLNSTSKGTYVLRTRATGLLVGEKYEYAINYLDSNWPVVVSPQSGSFIATQDNKVIYTDIGFCFPSGECAMNTKDVILKYRTNSLYNKNPIEFISLNLSVQQSGCPQSIAYGKDYKIECNDCVPNNPVRVTISGGPLLNLGSCCSGTRLMLVDVSGASSSDRYKYEFLSLTDNITFNQPSSGYLTFTKNGSGVIMGIANTSLSNYDEGVVRFRLFNENNGIEANDYLGIKCGPNECAT